MRLLCKSWRLLFLAAHEIDKMKGNMIVVFTRQTQKRSGFVDKVTD